MSMGTELISRELLEKYNIAVRIRDEASRAGLREIVIACDEVIDKIIKQIIYEIKKSLMK